MASQSDANSSNGKATVELGEGREVGVLKCMCVYVLVGWGGGSVKEERGKIGADKIRFAFLLEKSARVCTRKRAFIFRVTV